MEGTQEEIRYWTRGANVNENRMTKSNKRLGAEVHLLPSLLPGIRVHTIDLDDWGALCQVGSDDDLRKVNEKRYVNSQERC
jgi:hypothetical protein